MKVVIINGSPRQDGNTAAAINEVLKIFSENDVEVDLFNIGNKDIRGCVACLSCIKTQKCVFNDIVNEAAERFKEADGLILASPVYFGSATGPLIAFADRLFCSTKFDRSMKVGASIVVARRSGSTATFDLLNKYFTFCGMPICSSQYWNNVYGDLPGEANEDAEGLQTMRVLARNMIFLMKSIALGKEAYGLPESEARIHTNYIR